MSTNEALILKPKVHYYSGEVISGNHYWSDGTPVSGQQFTYSFDTIGNRTQSSIDGAIIRRSTIYNANYLNQYDSIQSPGFKNILGSANSSATVTVWGANASYAQSSRKGDYFRAELALDNSQAPVWLRVTNLGVMPNANGQDVIAKTEGNVYQPKAVQTVVHDEDGNLSSDGRWIYTWDAENRLVSMAADTSLPASARQKLEFAYDYMGRRIQKKVSNWNGSAWVLSSDTRFAYDGWNLVGTFSSSFALQNSFTWGLDASGTLQGAGGVGGLLSMIVHSGANAGTYLYAYDGNHNVSALFDAALGTTAAQYEYGPFGELLRLSGTCALPNPFRFSGKYQDDESDLLYYGYRYYTAITGRWLNRDPLKELGGPNLYVAMENDPLSALDPSGLKVIVPCRIDDYIRNNAISGVEAIAESGAFVYSGEKTKFSNTDLKSEIVGSLIRSKREFRFASKEDLVMHILARIHAIDFAKRLQAGFSTRKSGGAIFPKKYWDHKTTPNGVAVPFIKRNLTLDQLKAAYQSLRDDPKATMPCGEACKQALYAGAVFARYAGYPESYNLRESKGQSETDWVPGDWGSIQNTGKYERGSGYEGENILYLGNGDYWGHLGENLVLKLDDWKQTVDDWDRDKNPSFKLEDWRKYTPAGLK